MEDTLAALRRILGTAVLSGALLLPTVSHAQRGGGDADSKTVAVTEVAGGAAAAGLFTFATGPMADNMKGQPDRGVLTYGNEALTLLMGVVTGAPGEIVETIRLWPFWHALSFPLTALVGAVLFRKLRTRNSALSRIALI